MNIVVQRKQALSLCFKAGESKRVNKQRSAVGRKLPFLCTSSSLLLLASRSLLLAFVLSLTSFFQHQQHPYRQNHYTMFTSASKYSSLIAVSSSKRSTTLSSAFVHNKQNGFLPRKLKFGNSRTITKFDDCPFHALHQPVTCNNIARQQHNYRLFSIAPDQVAYSIHEDESDQNIVSAYYEVSSLTSSPPTHDTTSPPPEQEVTIKSKPIPGGNWNPDDPLGWSKNFGRRDPEIEKELFQKAQLKPDDEGYFDVSKINVPGVTIVRTKAEAEIVMKRLMSPESKNAIHACDTEVMAIDLKSVGPVGNGFVTCASVYSGPDFDYGLGDGPGTALWIDNLDDSFGVLQYFKEFFEDDNYKTVWHNYGFDRHIMWNEGIDVKGFKGDTMHMARLQDTSRAKYGVGAGYSLEALTNDFLGRRKKPMKEIFGVARLRKDGSAGSLIDVPPVEVLQRDPRFRKQWIIYSAYDAEGTWLLRDKLQTMLEKMEWVREY